MTNYKKLSELGKAEQSLVRVITHLKYATPGKCEEEIAEETAQYEALLLKLGTKLSDIIT